MMLMRSTKTQLDQIAFTTDSTSAPRDGPELHCRSSCESLGQGSKQAPIWVDACDGASLDWFDARSSEVYHAKCSSHFPLWVLLSIIIPLACLVLLLAGLVAFQWVRAWQMQYKLLLQALPGRIARRLQKGDKVFDRYTKAVIVFADIVGYTAFSKSLACQELVDILSDIFHELDRICENLGMLKVKTIGDCYMAASGCLGDNETESESLLRAAVFAMETCDAIQQLTTHNHGLQFRAGLHQGEVTAAVIGRERITYDMWGETVNTAARLESVSLPSKVSNGSMKLPTL